MKFLFALLALAWYVSHVQATDIPKSAFCMNAAPVPLKIQQQVIRQPQPEPVRQEWRQFQVCYGNFCRMEWRLMPVNQPSATPIQTYQSSR